MRNRRMAHTSVLVVMASRAVTAAIINVPGDFLTIQEAFDAAASGDEIVVAPGTYAGAAMINAKAITLRSSGGAAVTTLLGDGAAPIILRPLSSSGTTIDGFTLTNGGGVGAVDIHGSTAIDIVIANCIIENSTSNGALIAPSTGGPLTVTNTIFRNNAGLALRGSYNTPSNPVDVSGSTFFNNLGGAMDVTVPTVVTDCTFQDNASAGSGAAIVHVFTMLTATRCQFINNAAAVDGGAILAGSLNSSVIDCSFTGNMAGGDGGAIHSSATLSIVNSTFDANSAIAGSGGGLFATGTTSVTGCILIGNAAAITGGGIRAEPGASVPMTQTTYCQNTPNDLDLAGSTVIDCLVTGACCVPGGGCVSTTAASCLSAGGTFQGDGVLCADAMCPANCAGDANNDLVVDFNDVNEVLANWLSMCP